MADAIAAVIYNIMVYFLNGMLQAIVSFLNMFVAQPAAIPGVVHDMWQMSVNISTGVITLATIYALVKSSAQSISGSTESAKDIIGRSVVSVFMAQASWTIFVEWLLPLNNTIVAGILSQFSNMQINMAQGLMLPSASVVGALVGAAVMGPMFVLVFLALLLVLAMVVAIGVWLVRNMEIIFLIILAPIAASFTVLSGQVNSWRWLLSELVSAIFSQAMLIVFLFISFSIMFNGGGAMTMNSSLVTNGGSVLQDFALGVTGIFLSFKSHSWLKGMMTGRSVGSDHGALGLAAGMALGGMAKNLTPGGLALDMKQHLGKAGLGEFSKGGRKLMAASSANKAQASAENPDFYSAGVASQADADTSAMSNPHTRSSVATATGLKAEVQAQGMAGNAPAIQIQKAAGQSAAAHHSGARAAANQATVDSEVAYSQDPQVMAAKAVSRTASVDYMRTARSKSDTDVDIMQGGFSNLADTYQSFGYGQEESGQSSESSQPSSSRGLTVQGNRGVSTRENPYLRKQNGGEK